MSRPLPGATQEFQPDSGGLRRQDSSYLPELGPSSAPATEVRAGGGDGSGYTAPWLATRTPGPRDPRAPEALDVPRLTGESELAVSLGRGGPGRSQAVRWQQLSTARLHADRRRRGSDAAPSSVAAGPVCPRPPRRPRAPTPPPPPAQPPPPAARPQPQRRNPTLSLHLRGWGE